MSRRSNRDHRDVTYIMDETPLYRTVTVAPDTNLYRPHRQHRKSFSLGSTAITKRATSGHWVHPAMRDEPTGRHILSDHEDPVYKRNQEILLASSIEARNVYRRLLHKLGWANTEKKLKTDEIRDLASQ